MIMITKTMSVFPWENIYFKLLVHFDNCFRQLFDHRRK